MSNKKQSTCGFLRNGEAANYLGLSEVTIWRLSENDPSFPKKVRLTKRCVGFMKSDIDAYLNSKKAA